MIRLGWQLLFIIYYIYFLACFPLTQGLWSDFQQGRLDIKLYLSRAQNKTIMGTDWAALQKNILINLTKRRVYILLGGYFRNRCHWEKVFNLVGSPKHQRIEIPIMKSSCQILKEWGKVHGMRFYFSYCILTF